jgi:hypothetical protein
MWWYTPVIPAMQEVKIRRIEFKSSPGKKLVRPHLNKQASEREVGR